MSPSEPTPSPPGPAAPPALPWPVELDPDEIADRLRWARQRGHPRYPWPEIPVGAWRGALGEIEEATRTVLAGGTASLPERDRPGTRALGVAAFTSGMGPLLGAWAGSGALEAPGEVGAVLEAHLFHGRLRAVRLAAELERAAAALAGAGVRPLVVKAGHTARVYFPEPGARPAADLDLVVTPPEWRAAEQALARAGWMRVGGQRRPLKSEWLAVGSPSRLRSLELAHGDDPVAIDLHASLDRDFFGVRTVRLPGAARRPFPMALAAGDVPADVLAQPELLLFHALHASEGLHSLTLVRLAEIVLMIRRDRATGALEERAARDLMERTGAGRFVHPALVLAERLAPGTVPAGLLEAAAARATPRMHQLLAGLSPSDAQRPTYSTLAESLVWCATPAEYLRRGLHMLAPAPAGGLRALADLYALRVRRVLRGRVGVAADRPE